MIQRRAMSQSNQAHSTRYRMTASQAVNARTEGQGTRHAHGTHPPPGTPRDRIEFMILDPPIKF